LVRELWLGPNGRGKKGVWYLQKGKWSGIKLKPGSRFKRMMTTLGSKIKPSKERKV